MLLGVLKALNAGCGPTIRGCFMDALKRIIFPLDGMNAEQAETWMYKLRDHIGFVKIGLELFTREGPEVVKLAQQANMPVMLDLKLHDIPNTMVGAVRAAVGMGVKLITVHASAGDKALKACVEATEGTDANIVAVTLLTSLDSWDAARIFEGLGVWRKPPQSPDSAPARIVERLVVEATQAGVDYFVCSPQEASGIKQMRLKSVVITPGIRMGQGHDDQKRVGTPEGAIGAGADYLVIGRPIRESSDPLATIDEIRAGIEIGWEWRTSME